MKTALRRALPGDFVRWAPSNAEGLGTVIAVYRTIGTMGGDDNSAFVLWHDSGRIYPCSPRNLFVYEVDR